VVLLPDYGMTENGWCWQYCVIQSGFGAV